MSETKARLFELWRAVYGEPPPIDAEPDLLLRMLVRHLPAPPPYGMGPVRGEEPVG